MNCSPNGPCITKLLLPFPIYTCIYIFVSGEGYFITFDPIIEHSEYFCNSEQDAYLTKQIMSAQSDCQNLQYTDLKSEEKLFAVTHEENTLPIKSRERKAREEIFSFPT